MKRRPLAWLLLSGWCAFLPATLHAGPKEDAQSKRKEGDKLFAAGEYEAALKTYEDGANLLPDPSFALARAQVLVKLRRYDEAKRAYELYLSESGDKKRTKEVKRALDELDKILRTTLECQTEPAGATVYLSSKLEGALGEAPLRFHLSPGTHRLILEKPGFVTIEERLDIKEGETLTRAFTLSPSPLSLSLQSEPSGAEVYVAGVRRGVTPLTLELPAGEQELELRSPGMAPARHAVKGSPGEQLSLSVELQPAPVELRLSLSPQDAQITVTGRSETMSGGVLLLPPGEHELRIHALGYQETVVPVQVKRGEAQTLSFALTATGEVIRLQGAAPKTEIIVDGARLGTAAEHPAFALPWGRHTLELRPPGAAPYQGALDIQRGTPLDLALNARPAKRPLTRALLLAGGASAGVGVVAQAGAFRQRLLINQAEDSIDQDGDGAVDAGASADALQDASDDLDAALNRRQTWLGGMVLSYAVSAALLVPWWLRARNEGRSTLSVQPRSTP